MLKFIPRREAAQVVHILSPILAPKKGANKNLNMLRATTSKNLAYSGIGGNVHF